jgi:butyrate kinase
MIYRVLAINPGSTSTKIAVYDDINPVFEKTLRHDPAELEPFGGIIEQYEFRKNLVLEAMRENGVEPNTLHAAVGRGGLLRSVPGGTWKISENMLRDLKDSNLWGRIHASNLGAFIAKAIADELSIPAFIVDPVVVDEFDDIARISGIPEIERKSLFHALNIRYLHRLVAAAEQAKALTRSIQSAFTWVEASRLPQSSKAESWLSIMVCSEWVLSLRKEPVHCRLETCSIWLFRVSGTRKSSPVTSPRPPV